MKEEYFPIPQDLFKDLAEFKLKNCACKRELNESCATCQMIRPQIARFKEKTWLIELEETKTYNSRWKAWASTEDEARANVLDYWPEAVVLIEEEHVETTQSSIVSIREIKKSHKID